MLGRKDKQFQQHQAVCLEDIVPQKNFYRQLEATLDSQRRSKLLRSRTTPQANSRWVQAAWWNTMERIRKRSAVLLAIIRGRLSGQPNRS